MSKNKLQEAIANMCGHYHHFLTDNIEGFIKQLSKVHEDISGDFPRCKPENFRYSVHDNTYHIRLSETFSMVAHLVKGEI